LLLYCLVQLGGWSHLSAAVVATEVAILSNFVLNDGWTFRNARTDLPWLQRLVRYNVVSLGGLAVSISVLAALTSLLGIYYLAANLFAIGSATLWNYTVNAHLTWGQSSLKELVRFPRNGMQHDFRPPSLDTTVQRVETAGATMETTIDALRRELAEARRQAKIAAADAASAKVASALIAAEVAIARGETALARAGATIAQEAWNRTGLSVMPDPIPQLETRAWEVPVVLSVGPVGCLSEIDELADALDDLPILNIDSRLLRAGFYRIDAHCPDIGLLADWLQHRPDVHVIDQTAGTVHVTLTAMSG